MDFREYKRAYIRLSRLNPRKNFKRDTLEEPAASIRQVGVKEPILIRWTSL
jgi:ParB-like chromosome segregation protein Spo0J